VRKWLLLVVVIVVLDQWTKYLADTRLDYGHPVELLSWFNLYLAYNTGAAFNFLSEAGGWQRWFFGAVAVVAIVVLIAWLRRLDARDWPLSLSLSLILSGAIGNLIDRIWLGYVIDFIQWHYRDWYWPAFNLADSAITAGVTVLVLRTLFASRDKSHV